MPLKTTAWDFLVAGAGPAGSRAAELLAARGASVVLLDPRVPYDEPCSIGLTAGALEHTPELRELKDYSEIVTEVLVVVPSRASVVVPLRAQCWVVSRLTLSRWGLERAQAAGARFVPAAARSADREYGVWRVKDSRGAVYRARWILAADGATSWLRGWLAPKLKPQLDSARVAATPTGFSPGRAALLLLPVVKGCLWAFPRPVHQADGTGWRILNTETARFAQTDDEGPTRQRGAVMATWVWRSGGFADIGGRDFALLGDAAGLANPLTGEGIDYALRSAVLAVQAFDERSGFARYPSMARRAFGVEIRRARWLQKWLYWNPDTADKLMRRARQSPRWTLLLMSMLDAVNEHGSLRRALSRALFAGAQDRTIARDVCDSPNGVERDPQDIREVCAGKTRPRV